MKQILVILGHKECRASSWDQFYKMVAELVRASYLIDMLTILKVEGSNPGGSILFLVEKFKKNGKKFGQECTCACAIVGKTSIAHARNLDFRYSANSTS